MTLHFLWPNSISSYGYMGFPDSSVGKESTCNAGDPCSITGLGRSIQEGIGYPLQYSGLENSMDCTVHGVTKSWTRLSDFHFHFSLCSTEFVLMSVLCYFDHCSFEVCFGIRTYETSNFVFSSRLLCSFAVPWNSVWISGWIFLFLKEKYYLEILTRTLNLFR